MSRRTRQVGDLIREELDDIIRNEVKDPRIGFFTLTRVDMSPDLRTATAYVSVMGTDEERQANLDALESANGYIRRQLKPRLRMRTIPDIVFFDDRSMEYAQSIATALNSIPASETLADVPPRRQQDDD